MKAKKITKLSLLIAVAVALNIFEKVIPLPMIAPGAKIGLANIVTMICILTMSYKDAFLVVSTRIILGAIFSTGLISLTYSFSGAILSFVAMLFVKKIFKDSISAIGLSITGAVFHNIGQIIVAIYILSTFKIISYLPVLIIVAIFSGGFIGLSTNYFINHFKKIV